MALISEDRMPAIRCLAFEQTLYGKYDVTVYSVATGQDINDPWQDSTGRIEFAEDEEAIKYWGLDLFDEFCYLADDFIERTGWVPKGGGHS